MFNKPKIKPNDRSPLREFQRQIKLSITWLSSVEYKRYFIHTIASLSTIQSQKRILQAQKSASLTYGTFNLIIFESWLDSQIQLYFNLLI